MHVQREMRSASRYLLHALRRHGRVIPTILSAMCLVAASCATQTAVDQKIALAQAEHEREIASVQSQVESLEQRNSELTAKLDVLAQAAQEALQRVQEAGVLAKGQVVFEQSFSLDTVRFPRGDARLSADAKAILDNFASQLQSLDEFYLEIQGHAEDSEANAHALSLRRADAVRLYLSRQHRVPLRSMSVISYDTSSPIASNRTAAGRAANRRVAIIVLDGGEHVAMAQQYPLFPWPPPAASGTTPIPRELLVSGSDATTLSDVDTRLQAALEAAGYPRGSYFAVPGGFALVTRLEQINRDGTPKAPPDRWLSTGAPTTTDFTLLSYLRALFLASPGYYRVVVFVVTPLAFAQAPVTITPAETTQWTETGLNRLPRQIGSLTFTPTRYECTALVYEFQRASESDAPTVNVPGAVLARAHLEKAGVLAALQQLR